MAEQRRKHKQPHESICWTPPESTVPAWEAEEYRRQEEEALIRIRDRITKEFLEGKHA